MRILISILCLVATLASGASVTITNITKATGPLSLTTDYALGITNNATTRLLSLGLFVDAVEAAPLVFTSASNHFTGNVGVGGSLTMDTLNVAGDVIVTGSITGDASGLTNFSASSVASSWTGSGTFMTRFGTNATPAGATIDLIAAAGVTITTNTPNSVWTIGASGASYTNNTDPAGVVVGSGVGSNLTSRATWDLSSASNYPSSSLTYTNYLINIEDHFIYGNFGNNIYVNNWFALQNSGTFYLQSPVDNSHVGVVAIATSTSASASPILYLSSTSGLLGNGRALDTTYIWRNPTLSDDTENYLFRFGLMDTTTSAAPTDGVFVRYSNNTNSGMLEFVARAASTETATNTGFTVSANTWITNRIVVASDSSLATLYTNGVVAATLSSNIPDNSGGVSQATGLGAWQIIKSAGTTSRAIIMDYWSLKY